MSRKIILASTSPRRIEILEKAGLEFEVVKPEYEEDMTLKMPPAELAKYLASMKAKSVAKKYPDAIIIAADTFVVLDGKIYGKPETPARAKGMLAELSGRPHKVVTGFSILDTKKDKGITEVDIATVIVKNLTEQEIDDYVATGKPMDKAAAYAIQDGIPGFIEKLDGNYLTVMGLPLDRVLSILKQFGV